MNIHSQRVQAEEEPHSVKVNWPVFKLKKKSLIKSEG